MKHKKTLATIVLASAVGLAGCNTANNHPIQDNNCTIQENEFEIEIIGKKEEPGFLFSRKKYTFAIKLLDKETREEIMAYSPNVPSALYRNFEIGEKLYLTMYSKDGEAWFFYKTFAERYGKCPEK